MKINGITFKEDPSVKVCAVKVGPKEAEAIIAHMVSNQRNLSPMKVMEYAKEMSEQKWKVSNDAMVVCQEEWLNSNHRMHAIIKSGTEQTLLLLQTEDPSLLRVIDGGKPRVISDALKVETGMSYCKDVASVGSLVMSYQMGLLTSGGYNAIKSKDHHLINDKIITRQDRIAFCLKHAKGLTNCIIRSDRMVHEYGPVLSRCQGATLLYLIEQKDGEVKADEFVAGVFSGEAISGSQKALRKILTMDSKSRDKMPSVTRFGMCLKAYIFHRNGTTPGVLVLKRSEDYPRI